MKIIFKKTVAESGFPRLEELQRRHLKCPDCRLGSEDSKTGKIELVGSGDGKIGFRCQCGCLFGVDEQDIVGDRFGNSIKRGC